MTFQVTIDFLQELRPPPWILTAIVPDGPTDTITAHTVEEATAFLGKHNGKNNLYYTLNVTRTAMSKKPKKADIVAVEYLHADLDPADSETPEAAKARFLGQFENSFEPKPTWIVDSGNGVQAGWRMDEPIGLEGGDREALIPTIEGRSKEIMLRLGSEAGTQNIDRILRLPGTINVPNKKKLEKGRVACPTALLKFNGASYGLDAFPIPAPEEQNKPGTPEDGGHHARQPVEDEEDKLDWTIKTGGDYRDVGKRSDGVWYVINEMLRRGYLPNVVVATLLNRANKISDHVYDQSNPRQYAERQVARAKKEITLSRDDKDVPYKTQNNIRIALHKMGVMLRYDEFADRTLISGLPDFGPVLDDAALDRIWLLLERRFRLSVSKDLTRTVITDTARLNKFHPVCDYLASLKWDGTKRIDTWLTIYGGVEDNDYSRAVGALFLTAAVRRVRNPGCKFDEMVILEHEVQGTDKSTALATLAVKEEWFSDDLPLSVEGKQVIECLRGRWIVEAGEMSGIKRTDIAHIKALLSRQVDRARLAYGRIVSEVPRQCVIVGTTNDLEYLRDTSGNRRFWPVRCLKFDVVALRRDRDQLWAEAAAREATGISIRLSPELWPNARAEQTKRLTRDPWLEALQEAGLENMVCGKISMGDIWIILDVRGGQQTQEQSKRVGAAMRDLGWRRPSESGLVKIDGEPVSGYVKGEKPWPTVHVKRYKDGELCITQNGKG
jgi:predicted P-loop ATPase